MTGTVHWFLTRNGGDEPARLGEDTLRTEGETMIQTVEAVIDEEGNVRLLEPVHLPSVRRALVTILEDRQVTGPSESALLSEAALAEDWDRPEEDEAWSHLQRAQ